MELCSYMLYAANLTNPPEYCDNDAVEDEEFCELHLDDPDYWRYEE